MVQLNLKRFSKVPGRVIEDEWHEEGVVKLGLDRLHMGLNKRLI